MKRKILSIIISSIIVISQASITPSVNAAIDGNSSSNRTVSNGSAENQVIAKDQIIKSISPNIIVDKNYSGGEGDKVNGVANYKNISSAIASIDVNNAEEKIIFIRNGVYKEKITVSTPNITIVGESAESTILTYDDAAGTIKRTEDGGDKTKTYGTTGSASLTLKGAASNFKAANLTVSNSFDEAANPGISGQAVAMKNEADKSVFVNCKFIGNQDTLYANKNKQYYSKCFIEGDVDFIFGGAQAVFKDCEIKSVNRGGISPKGYVTAPSTLESDKFGYLMLDCKLTSDITDGGKVYLGRPWHPSSSTAPMISSIVYKNCYLGAHIAEDGWSKMSNNLPKDNDMYEYKNYGPGANTNNVNRRQLTDEEAENYTTENVLSGWNPVDDINKLSEFN